jgi:hypothetical protein
MPEPRKDEDASSRPESQPGPDPILYCPLCSTRLGEHRCKLICEKCGYYLSCSDYY